MAGGFKWIGTQNADPRGTVKTFPVAVGHASRLAIGDAVIITSTSNAAGDQEVDAAAAGAAVTGIIVGIVPNFATESFTDTGLAASTLGSVIVNTDPRAEYEVDVSNGPLLVTEVGLNAPLVATAATVSGGLTISNMTLNRTGAATTALTEFRIVKLLTGSDGVLGSRAVVRLNWSTAVPGAAGV
jgi:hypothetical protein